MTRKSRSVTKRLLRLSAVLLTCIMLVGLFPFAVFADGTVNPVADTYVSSANPTAVYGNENVLLVDGSTSDEKIAFLTYEAWHFTGKDMVSLTIPVNVTRGGKLMVYLINNYAVDEATFCYRNMPVFGAADRGYRHCDRGWSRLRGYPRFFFDGRLFHHCCPIREKRELHGK